MAGKLAAGGRRRGREGFGLFPGWWFDDPRNPQRHHVVDSALPIFLAARGPRGAAGANVDRHEPIAALDEPLVVARRSGQTGIESIEHLATRDLVSVEFHQVQLDRKVTLADARGPCDWSRRGDSAPASTCRMGSTATGKARVRAAG